MKKTNFLREHLGTFILLLIVAHHIGLLTLVLIVQGVIDIPDAFSSVALATIMVTILMIVTVIASLICMNGKERNNTVSVKDDWQTVQRGFVLWTLLIHGRNPDGKTSGELILQDKNINEVCKRMAERLTDEDYNLLAEINPQETTKALELMEKFNPKKE